MNDQQQLGKDEQQHEAFTADQIDSYADYCEISVQDNNKKLKRKYTAKMGSKQTGARAKYTKQIIDAYRKGEQ